MTAASWFSGIPEHWSSARINYHYAVTLGKMLNANAEGEGVPAPYLAAGSIQPEALVLDETRTMSFTESELASYSLRAGDIVVVEGGAGYGRSHLLPHDLPGWGFQNHVARLRSVTGALTPPYLLYCLKACLASGYIEANNRTATLPSLSRDVLGAIRMPIPPLAEQHGITALLDQETTQIDTLVEEQHRLIELLRERKRAVLDEVTAMATGPQVRLKYLFTPSSESNRPDEDVLSVYRDFGVILKASRDDNFNRTPENLARYLLVRPGDLVVNRMKAWQGSLGVSALRGIVSGDYEVARPVDSRLLPRFAHLFLRSPRMIAEYALRSTGIRPSQWRLYWDQMGNISVPVPPPDVQQDIADRVEDQTAKIDTLIAETERFIELARERRSALVTGAVTGQINVQGKVA